MILSLSASFWQYLWVLIWERIMKIIAFLFGCTNKIGFHEPFGLFAGCCIRIVKWGQLIAVSPKLFSVRLITGSLVNCITPSTKINGTIACGVKVFS